MTVTAAVLLIISAITHAGWNYVTNASYVATFRQLSIPLGALFGMALLKEPRYNSKIVGVAVIFMGLIMVGFG